MCENPLEVQKHGPSSEKNSEHTVKDRCERSYGNIGKIIALRELFRCLSVNGKKKFRHV